MDTYIVHVYRREPGKRLITGLAERMGNGARQGFRTMDELWMFLEKIPGSDSSLPTNNTKEQS